MKIIQICQLAFVALILSCSSKSDSGNDSTKQEDSGSIFSSAETISASKFGKDCYSDKAVAMADYDGKELIITDLIVNDCNSNSDGVRILECLFHDETNSWDGKGEKSKKFAEEFSNSCTQLITKKGIYYPINNCSIFGLIKVNLKSAKDFDQNGFNEWKDSFTQNRVDGWLSLGKNPRFRIIGGSTRTNPYDGEAEWIDGTIFLEKYKTVKVKGTISFEKEISSSGYELVWPTINNAEIIELKEESSN